jgi:hypothetical protein
VAIIRAIPRIKNKTKNHSWNIGRSSRTLHMSYMKYTAYILGRMK